jgi:hypothetical protein
MSKRRIILASVVCLFAAGWLSQAICQTQARDQRGDPTGSKRAQQLTGEERRKEFEKRVAERRKRGEQWVAERRKEFEQQTRDRANGKDQRRNEFIQQALGMTEAQWKVIEPKINRIYFLKDQATIGIGVGGGGASYGSQAAGRAGAGPASGAGLPGTYKAGSWKAQSSSHGGSAGGGSAGGWTGPAWRLAGRKLTPGEKSCERLLTLLNDKNSKQGDIEQAIDALRRAKENAAKELAKARRELREVLTFRQQARLVLAGVLD